MIGQGDHQSPSTTTQALQSVLPRERFHPSPGSWQDEVIYFLLPDRFSDEDETRDELADLKSARPAGWDFAAWADSGAHRFQGGTIKGIQSRLPYLKELGITALWLGPPWKQRAESNDYHGYSIQNFLDIDPRFGCRQDLVDLVDAAHEGGLRVIFDIVVNHTAENWLYAGQTGSAAAPPRYRQYPWYDFGTWLGGDGTPLPAGTAPTGPDDGVWPQELQDPDAYHRAGAGDYGDGSAPCSAWAQFRRADWFNRDLALTDGPLRDDVLQVLIDCWTYWLRLTNCDGFRIDTFKHFRVDEGRRFCAAIKETAAELGKDNFLLAAEIGGGDDLEEQYLNLLGRSLSAALEIGELRSALREVAAGTAAPDRWFSAFHRSDITTPSESSECPGPQVGTHRDFGDAFIYTIDDHDDVWLTPLRFAAEHPGQVVPAISLLLLTLGTPCLYYGTEQGFTGPPDPDVRAQLPSYGGGPSADRYLREAMFGPAHPRRSGWSGIPGTGVDLDDELPGFGPFGTAGKHAFRTGNPIFLRTRHLLSVRAAEPALRRGRQYLRQLRTASGEPFGTPAAGGLLAWSRLLGSTEALVVVNLDPDTSRSADITVDAVLNANGAKLRIAADTYASAPTAGGRASRVGATVPVVTTDDGRRYVRIADLEPTEVLVLTNRES